MSVSLEKKREKLKREKPLVYEKVMKYDEKVKNQESIALIVLNYEYICNFKCEHCSSDGLMIKNAEDRRKANARKHLTPESVKHLCEEADELGLAHITISGGESLMYPDLDKVIEAINPKKYWISVDTNGWFLDEKRARHLKSIGLDKVNISLDNLSAEEHDSFRHKKGAYARVMRAIESAKKAGLSVLILTVVWKDRAESEEFLNFLKVMEEKEVEVYVSLAKPIGAWAGNLEQVCGDKEIEKLKEINGKHRFATRFFSDNGIDMGCISVKRSITITKYGDVMPCPYIQTSIGNIFDESLKDILNRGLKIKYFAYGEKHTCLAGNKDHEFVQKIMPKIWTSKEPVSYKKVFTAEDFVDGKMH